MHNPVIKDILALLHQFSSGISEYEIIRSLADHEAFKSIEGDNSLALFKKHFLVMNALYQLRIQLWSESRQVIDISPLHIQLYDCTEEGTSDALCDHDSCSDYYLDWNNYQQTSASDVESLIDNFWQHYSRQDKRQAAMARLELDEDASPQEIEHQYRRLVSIHHPDKGGDEETFIHIRTAYEQLR